jgi:spermidine/putrescine transport system substrate-binding protein
MRPTVADRPPRSSPVGRVRRAHWIRTKSAFDRGSFLKRGAAAGVGLYGAGGGLTLLSTRLSPKAIQHDGDLQFFNRAQYMNPTIISGFEKEYKVKVQQSYFANMQGMLSKIRAGVKYDATFPEAGYADQLVQAMYLAARPRGRA